MSSTSSLRKSVLSVAMGLCLSSLVAAPALAQSATGAVAGRASAGDQVVLVNSATGASRSVEVAGDGSYRLNQLPVGDYSLQVKRAGQDVGSPVAVSVSLGGTTTVNLGNEGNLTNLDAVQVVGSRVVNRVDVRSTETATNISRQEWSRLPVDQGLSAVALLAPGVVSNARLGGLSFGGSSMAENVVYINGMNVTDPYYRQGFSSVPFGFYQEFQVKTGGYSAEFGRSTGGVINAVTRSGGNEFHGGVELTFEPAAWSEPADDHFHEDGTLHNRASRDDYSFYKANVWASGPILKDRLFFFAMYEQRDTNSRESSANGLTWTDAKSGNGFWGTKLDWNITDDHKLELLAFSDEADSTSENYNYNWNAYEKTSSRGAGVSGSGGKNWSVTYTGHFTQNFSGKAMYGVNNRSSNSGTPLDGECSVVGYDSSYASVAQGLRYPLGCHPTGSMVSSREDERKMTRADFEWALGDHLLRFGYDRELMTTQSADFYPGDGFSYQAQAVAPGSVLQGGGDVPPVLSSAAIWSPIPQSKEIGREEALFRRADHRLPA